MKAKLNLEKKEDGSETKSKLLKRYNPSKKKENTLIKTFVNFLKKEL